MAIVLFSAFTGIFFTSQSDEMDALNSGLVPKEGCDGKTISDELDNFAFAQNKEKVNGRPYYYSIKEKYMDFKEEVSKYLNNPDKPNYISQMEEFVNQYADRFEPQNAKQGGVNQPSIPSIPSIPQMPGGLDKKQINQFALMAFGKFKTVIMAIIRIIIAMACLPIAQIFVSCFFLYTTSGIGLLIEEGGLFTAMRRIKVHMNDNDGEDEKAGEINHFYAEINKTSFFKFWINELFLTTIYAIYVVVKFATVPTQLSKIEVKITTAIIIGAIAAGLIVRAWLLHTRHCNMNAKHCFFNEKAKSTSNSTTTSTSTSDSNNNNIKKTQHIENRFKNILNNNQKTFDLDLTDFNNINDILKQIEIDNNIVYTNIQNNYLNNIEQKSKKEIEDITQKIINYTEFFKNIQTKFEGGGTEEEEKEKSLKNVFEKNNALSETIKAKPTIIISDLVNSKMFKIIIQDDKNVKLVINIDDKTDIVELLKQNINFKLKVNDKVLIGTGNNSIPLGSIILDTTQKLSFKIDDNLENVTVSSDETLEVNLNKLVMFYVDVIQPNFDEYNYKGLNKAKTVNTVMGLERTNVLSNIKKMGENRFAGVKNIFKPK